MKEIVRYGILDNVTGYMKGLFMSENEAITDLNYLKGCTIVKLVGQMPEPKRMKKVALFVLRDNKGQVLVPYSLRTKDEAKAKCDDAGYTLLQWPYGEIIEVEDL